MIGNKIRRLRKAHGMTQEDLANKLDVCRQTVMKWEKGITEPDIEIIRVAAVLFRTSPAELLDPHSDEGGILETIHSYHPYIQSSSHRALSGYVFDSGTGHGVPHASVEVIAKNGTCIARMTADENGFFIGSTGSEKFYTVRIVTDVFDYEIPKIRACPGETYLGGIDMQIPPAAPVLPAEFMWSENILCRISEEGVMTLSGSGAMDEQYSAPSGLQKRSPYRGLIRKVIIRQGITSVGAHAFDGYLNLEEVKLGKDVQKISGGAFMGCKKLKTVSFSGNKLEEINWNAFRGCVSLSRITLPESVRTLGSAAFAGCVSLTSVTIPENAEILSHVFEFCGNLKQPLPANAAQD